MPVTIERTSHQKMVVTTIDKLGNRSRYRFRRIVGTADAVVPITDRDEITQTVREELHDRGINIIDTTETTTVSTQTTPKTTYHHDALPRVLTVDRSGYGDYTVIVATTDGVDQHLFADIDKHDRVIGNTPDTDTAVMYCGTGAMTATAPYGQHTDAENLDLAAEALADRFGVVVYAGAESKWDNWTGRPKPSTTAADLTDAARIA